MIRKIILISLSIISFLAACDKTKNTPPSLEHPHGSAAPSPPAQPQKKILYYVDPMHPWYKSDKPGKAPDCGMDLEPVYAQEPTPESKPAPSPESIPDHSSLHLSTDQQQLIGVKTEKVERKPLSREIQAVGRVAYDPDLILAQNEYLIALKNRSGGDLADLQNSLVRASRDRLRLLGMSEAQIANLNSGQLRRNSLLPQKGEKVWVYGSIFETDLPWVKKGDGVQVILPGSNQPLSSTVESVDPIIAANTRTAQIRLRIPNQEGDLHSDLNVTLKIQASASESLAIPNDAILDSGTRQLAFVETQKGHFEPRILKLGKRGTEYTEVLGGLSEGEFVVSRANFLMDSESQLRATMLGSGTQMEGHQH